MTFSLGSTGGGNDKVQTPCLQKWGKKIYVSFLGDMTEDQKTIGKKALSEIADVTNRMIIFNKEDDSGQLNIIVNQMPNITEKNYKSKCSAKRTFNPQCEINYAQVNIPDNLNDKQFSYCFYHEVLHAFGFQGHVWSRKSILNPKLTETSLSNWDIRALKAIYQENLRTGSSIGQTISKTIVSN